MLTLKSTKTGGSKPDSVAEMLQPDWQDALYIQQRMLPANPATCNQLTVEYACTAAQCLSGDFVDLIDLGHKRSLFYIADVSGHGIAAALVTVLLKTLMHKLINDYKDSQKQAPPSITYLVEQINISLLTIMPDKHLTMFIGIYCETTEQLTYVSAGHHPVPILSCAEQNRFLVASGMPLGLFSTPEFEEKTIFLPAPFNLFLFSDGVLEQLSKKTGTAADNYLLKIISDIKEEGLQIVYNSILQRIIGHLPDDITIMKVSRY